MPRAILFLALAFLASSVRADDVSEAALAGRWKVVGTAPTAKNRDGLAELEKHGCYLYFEFAANGRAAIGIGSDSKAKLAALKKANPDVELEWAAKYEVVNGRVEVSGFPARLREPGGWLGDSATAIFRVRLEGDTLELTGPGGFVAFQKVKKTVAATGGAPGTKTNPKPDANSVVGKWRFTKLADSRTDFPDLYKRGKLYFYFEFAPDGTFAFATHSDDPTRPALKSKAGPLGAKGKYRVVPGNVLELSEVERVGGVAGLNLDNPKFTFAITDDTLVLSEDGARKLECARVAPVANPLIGAWRVTEMSRWTQEQKDAFAQTGTSTFLLYASDGTAKVEMRQRDGQLVPMPPAQPLTWKYRVASETEIDYYGVPQYMRADFGLAGLSDRTTVTFKLTGDTLVLTEADRKNTMTLTREKK
jgi:hypothetical protein